MNKPTVSFTGTTAREFLNSAALVLEQNHIRAFADTLFSASELMAKGMLLMLPDEGILRGKGHGLVSQKFNWWGGKVGITDPRYVKLLNRLSNLRGSARYLDRDFSLDSGEAKEMLDTAEDMYKDLCDSAPGRYAIGDGS